MTENKNDIEDFNSENEEQEEVELDESNEDESKTEKSEREQELEAEVAKFKRMSKQNANKAKKAKETTKSNQNELGYGEKAYLVANGIKGKEETALVESVMKESGKSLDDVLESSYLKHQLKELRDDTTTKKAVPSGSKRSKTSSRDQVDYWIAKGELPPADQGQLRRDVVNARIKSEKTSNFSDTPVIQ